MCGGHFVPQIHVTREVREESQTPERVTPSEATQTCPSCGAPVQPDFVLCPRCGTQLKRACPTCHKAVDVTWVACPYCGTPLDNDDV